MYRAKPKVFITILLSIVLLAACAQQAAPSRTAAPAAPTKAAAPAPAAAPTSAPAAAATAAPAAAQPATTGDVKQVPYGVVTALTGLAAPYGIVQQRVNQVMADDINKAGGFTVGGQRYNWQLIFYDHAGEPAKAVDAVTKLISKDNAKFVDVLSGGVAPAAIPILEKAGVLGLHLARLTKDQIGPKFPLTFELFSPADVMNTTIYPQFASQGVKTIALINPKSPLGEGGSKSNRQIAEKLGMKIVADEFFEQTATDFYPLLNKVLQAKPDMIDYGMGFYEATALLIKQAYQLGFKGINYTGNTVDPDRVVQLATPQAIEGTYAPAFVLPRTPMQLDFQKKYIERYGQNEWTVLVWDYTIEIPLMTAAIKKANSLEPTKVAEALQTISLETPRGPVYMGASKLFGNRSTLIKTETLHQFKGGKWDLIFEKAPDKNWLD